MRSAACSSCTRRERRKVADKEKKENETKRKGGVLSLILALALVLAAAGLAALSFTSAGYPLLEEVRAAVISWASFGAETISPAILVLILAVIVFASRRMRPFNYIFVPIAVVAYYTLLGGVHLVQGVQTPAFLMQQLSSTRTSLVFVLFILEILVSMIMMIINKPLNAAYARHKTKKLAIAQRKKELAAQTEGTPELSEEPKLSRKEEKFRLKEEKKQAKLEKKNRKGGKEESAPAEEKDNDVVVNVKASSRANVTLDPDSPLSFPETLHVPDFDTIPHTHDHVIAADSQEKTVQEHIYVPSGNVVSMSVLENSARNVEKRMQEEEKSRTKQTEKHLFRKGGMLESAIESTQKPVQDPGPNTNPIIGYTDRRKQEVRQTSSFAPSTLSPNHPRYKLFESLRKKNEPEEQKPAQPDVSHFPARNFSEGKADDSQEESSISISLKQQPAPEPAAKAEPKAEIRAEETHTKAPARPEPSQEAEPAAMPAAAPEPAPVRHKTAAKLPAEEPAAEEENILDSEDEESGDESSQIEFKVGVSGLTSNNAGESAIIKRQRRSYNPPSPDLLKDFPQTSYVIGDDEQRTGLLIASVMHDFKVEVELADIVKGPTVTLYEYTLAPGVLVSKVENLEKNIAMRIGGQKIRILAPVPGKSAVGIEVPNAKRVTVGFKELLKPLKESNLNVPMILGRDIQGDAKVLDVAKCPHLLIAGTTGSGKSVCINGLVASILYTKSPKEVRLIMVDPKVVELNVYNGIPHLLTPVITEPKRVLKMLSWLVEEMERRYKVFSQLGVRNIENFNSRIKDFGYATEKMPYIVLIMDEFADLMTVIGKDIEDYIRRLMAKARAAGIHVVMATQRPSAEVVTGTIKNNIPTRIAFAASSATNSRIILDEGGAENLLGKGDMLLSTQSSTMLTRIQGAFLSEDEVDKIVSYVKTQGEPDYLDEAIFEDEPEPDADPVSESEFENSDADLYEKAKQICFERKGASASYLQRRLSIGYNRAARLVEQMEEEGIVGPANGSKPREILRYE